MNRVIHFEIHVENPDRAAQFYRDLFGWEIKEWLIPGVEIKDENRYWIVMTAEKDAKEPGINGGMVFRRGPAPTRGQPVNAYVCTIGVPSIDAFVEKAVKAGATVAVPKMPIRGVGWLVYCIDPEGNLFGMMQDDKTAA